MVATGGVGSSMNPEVRGEVGERLTTPRAGDEPDDLGLVEAALNGTSNRFQGSPLLTRIGCGRAARSVSGGRVAAKCRERFDEFENGRLN